MLFEIVYDYADECTDCFDLREKFYCDTWDELARKVNELRKAGCYHIDATCVEGGE